MAGDIGIPDRRRGWRPGASILEAWLLSDSLLIYLGVGFGFAALESSGYAFGALLVRDGYTVRLSRGSLVFTELLRGILAPAGHVLWRMWSNGRSVPVEQADAVVGHDHAHATSAGRPGYS